MSYPELQDMNRRSPARFPYSITAGLTPEDQTSLEAVGRLLQISKAEVVRRGIAEMARLAAEESSACPR